MSLPYLTARVPSIPIAPIFVLARLYAEDLFPQKVDLGIGAYRDKEGKPYVLHVVRKVEQTLVSKGTSKEYLQSDGYEEFTAHATKLLYGENAPLHRMVRIQSLSGTGALRLGADFLLKFMGSDTPVYFSNPTWPNHPDIFSYAGFAHTKNSYRYFQKESKGVDFSGLMEDIRGIVGKAILVFQVAGHNPTGADLNISQWKELAVFLKSRKDLVTVMDSAYQGYATGDLEADAAPVRIFLDYDLHFLTAQSFAKNMGLYGERIGCLGLICPDALTAENVTTQMKGLVRASYSNPPRHGAMIVNTILRDDGLRTQWIEELKTMSDRIREMRYALREELERLKCPGSWKHITDQIGMFSYLGLSPEQCTTLVKKHHIYLTQSARISVSGLNTHNLRYVAQAISSVVHEN